MEGSLRLPRSELLAMMETNARIFHINRGYGYINSLNFGSHTSNGVTELLVALRICSNTACDNRENKVSEFLRCDKCTTPYCSKQCQDRDHNNHRHFCNTEGVLCLIYEKFDLLELNMRTNSEAIVIMYDTIKNTPVIFDRLPEKGLSQSDRQIRLLAEFIIKIKHPNH